MIDPRHPDYSDTPASPGRPAFGYQPLTPASYAPAVTIVTPYFNTGPVVRETARTVLAQSMQNFEWIIVNDGSTDRAALAELDALRRIDPRVRVIDHRANHGLPAARNTGVRAARAEYILFLDSDDLLEPTAAEKCLLLLECNPRVGFAKGYNVGFGDQEYLWDKGFHDGDKMLRENLVTATAMVRRAVIEDAGGFDESIRAGMEDWEFWIRCAARGHWGATIPEHLDWYRRRERQHDSWSNLSDRRRMREFVHRMRRRFPRLYAGAFPEAGQGWSTPFEPICTGTLPSNPLAKNKPRLLMIVPWLRLGGADRFNLDLLRYLSARAGWEVTVATTLNNHPWLSEFTRHTPDVFLLDHLATPAHYPRLLSYLIGSRRPDVVMVTNSQLGYAATPWLRIRHPEVSFVDFNHMEEEHWRGGGHPRAGVGLQEQLDLSITVSQHLKDWMVSRGAEAERVRVCHINTDEQKFRPDPAARAAWRARLGIADDVPVILYAARLCQQKQPLVFAQTMALLTERTDRFVALIAGDGELEAPLREALDKLRLHGRVRQLGPVPAERMPGLMAAADIFFLPSEWEGIALSIYEAMATGLAVVGADVGGQAELVTSDTGVLLPRPKRGSEREASAYAEALAALIADPQRARTLGLAARRRIESEFVLDRMGQRMAALLLHARDEHAARPRPLMLPGLAAEMAVQGVEMQRVHDLADHLWGYRERWRSIEQTGDQLRSLAGAELARIENARTFRLVRMLKTTGPYRLVARARFGPDWDRAEPKDDPVARLAHLRSSRSFRLVQSMKKLPPWSIYTRVRYGSPRPAPDPAAGGPRP